MLLLIAQKTVLRFSFVLRRGRGQSRLVWQGGADDGWCALPADLVHSLKPSPKKHVQEGWRVLDFLSHHPESCHIVRPPRPPALPVSDLQPWAHALQGRRILSVSPNVRFTLLLGECFLDLTGIPQHGGASAWWGLQ